MAGVFLYNPDAGALYARNFALYDSIPPEMRLFYYDMQDDCTNFISQCIWAAYGGWFPDLSPKSTDVNASRIKRDVRQITGVWFGSRNNIGSPEWCRVQELFSYVTAQKARGPMASLVAEGDFFTIEPGLIRSGDVIQMVVASYTPDRYGHSLYVTKAGLRWENVLICCHSIDRLNAPMTVFSMMPENYRKLRILRFREAVFDS